LITSDAFGISIIDQRNADAASRSVLSVNAITDCDYCTAKFYFCLRSEKKIVTESVAEKPIVMHYLNWWQAGSAKGVQKSWPLHCSLVSRLGSK